MVFSAVSGVAGGPVKIAQAQPIAIQVPDVTPKKVVTDNSEVQQDVRTYFSDVPVMVNIAYCESRFRQFDKEGNVFRGAVNNQDVGVMQINEHYHLDNATQENYNLYTVDGNMAYARELYEKFGTDPWNSSKPCWGDRALPSDSDANQVAAVASVK